MSVAKGNDCGISDDNQAHLKSSLFLLLAMFQSKLFKGASRLHRASGGNATLMNKLLFIKEEAVKVNGPLL